MSYNWWTLCYHLMVLATGWPIDVHGGWNPSCSITYYIYFFVYYIYRHYIIYNIYIYIVYIEYILYIYILNYIYTHFLISLVNLNHHIHTYSNIPNVFHLLCYLYSLAGSIPQMYIIVSDHMNMHPFFYPSLSLSMHTHVKICIHMHSTL